MKMKLLKLCLSLARLNQITNVTLEKVMHVSSVIKKPQEKRLGWFAHAIRKDKKLITSQEMEVAI